MKTTSSRRQLIVFVLLGLAMLGAAMRQWADNPSVERDIGTLLLVLWLPVVGNVVAFVIRRLRPPGPSLDFESGAAFTGQLLVELTPLASCVTGLTPDERGCTLAIGAEGFTARLPLPLAQWLAAGAPQALELQFRRPELALRRLSVDTVFRVMAGAAVVGTGRVLPQAPGQRHDGPDRRLQS
jgi:hypothetical protein